MPVSDLYAKIKGVIKIYIWEHRPIAIGIRSRELSSVNTDTKLAFLPLC